MSRDYPFLFVVLGDHSPSFQNRCRSPREAQIKAAPLAIQ
jgi:hypothetical protein